MAMINDHPDAPADEIVDEVRAIRRAHAEAHGFDMDKIVADLKQKEITSGVRLVSLPPKPVRSRQLLSGE